MTQLIFLGTGGDSVVIGKQYRASGGLVIKTADSQFHLDPGPGSLNKLKETGLNVRETTGIIVSNSLLKRANDINALISAMTLDGMDKKGVIVIDKNNKFLFDKYRDYLERVIYVNETRRIAICDTEIEIIEGKIEEIFHYRLLTPDLSIGYISDTGYDSNLYKNFEDTNIIIINCKNPADIKEDNNLNLDDVRTIIAKTKPKLAIITGFGIKMLEMDFLETARELQRSLGVQTIMATDGLKIEPQGYAKMSQQKTLTRF
ncbi:MAG: hypothetical protein QXG00_03990 [Candidatus Woesearchaeota archaeon]